MSDIMTFPPAQNRVHPQTGKISTGLFAANIAFALIIAVINFVSAGAEQDKGIFNGFAFVYFAIIAPILSLIGLILGIVGIFKKNHAKIFPILGIVLNGLWFICAVIMWILMGLALYAIANTPWR